MWADAHAAEWEMGQVASLSSKHCRMPNMVKTVRLVLEASDKKKKGVRPAPRHSCRGYCAYLGIGVLLRIFRHRSAIAHT